MHVTALLAFADLRHPDLNCHGVTNWRVLRATERLADYRSRSLSRPSCGGFVTPCGGLVSQGVDITVPIAVSHPGRFGPRLQPHQFLLASTTVCGLPLAPVPLPSIILL